MMSLYVSMVSVYDVYVYDVSVVSPMLLLLCKSALYTSHLFLFLHLFGVIYLR